MQRAAMAVAMRTLGRAGGVRARMEGVACAAAWWRPLCLTPSARMAAPAPSGAAVTVTAVMVKQLRDMTGAGMMDCKNALTASGGSMEGGVEWLRKKGMATAVKKASRAASQGLITIRLDDDATCATMVELNCETDFVARNDKFIAAADGVTRAAMASLTSKVAGDAAAVTGWDTAGADGAATSLAGAALSSGSDTVGTVVTSLVSTLGENCILRRAVRVSVDATTRPALLATYTHNNVAPGQGTLGVVVAVASATPGAWTEEERREVGALGRKIAMHVAAAKPQYLDRDRVPAAVLAQERSILRAHAASSGKPEPIIAKMVEGRLSKFFADTVLIDQPYVMGEDGKPVKDLLKPSGNTCKKQLQLLGFVLWHVGETAPPAAST